MAQVVSRSPKPETVVHKAIEKDPERRYQSVAEFAQDIERFLNHEPVLAVPPSTSAPTTHAARNALLNMPLSFR